MSVARLREHGGWRPSTHRSGSGRRKGYEGGILTKIPLRKIPSPEKQTGEAFGGVSSLYISFSLFLCDFSELFTNVQFCVEHLHGGSNLRAMFAKVFAQIFDSSIAEDFQARHVFMDLLVLADVEGAVDMTPSAISRRTNVPLEIVQSALKTLCAPDAESRSKNEQGRRLVPIDSARDWGWRIVNYQHYRELLNESDRRAYFRDYRRKERKSKVKRVPKNTKELGPISRHPTRPAEERAA